jgi:hypothetical protein
MKFKWKKRGLTYDSDKYEMSYRVDNKDTFLKSVWESAVYVGPEAYNLSNINCILDNMRNSCANILEPINPYFEIHCNQHRDNAKFKP